ncbi:MAG: LytTR family transcriptional regulator DNA-binding domain-containing protein [Ginsengibacter sp.]
MLINNFLFQDDLVNKLYLPNRSLVTIANTKDLLATNTEFIRFEEKKEKYTWAHPDEIYFIASADHYVKTLINCDDNLKWMSRHNTIKDMLAILPVKNFIRLNKFYLLNLNYFSHIDEGEKLLYFTNGFTIDIPHRISPFLRRLLKSTHT